MRSETWLADQLDFLLSKYFSNIKLSNPVEIKWGKEAKFRFGSIRLYPKSTKGTGGTKGIRRIIRRVSFDKEPKKSIITITSMFKSPKVPIKVVEYTICHELCHYAHGFSSSNKRLFRHPHHGGVVNQELTERGAGDLIGAFKKWLKEYRKMILQKRAHV